MAVAWVRRTSSNGGGSSFAPTLPTGIGAGNLLVLAVCAYSGGSVAVTTPSGWTLAASSTNMGLSDLCKTWVFYKVAGASETSPTMTGTFSNIHVEFSVFSGADTSTPVSASASGTPTSAATIPTPASTAAVANSLVAYFAFDLPGAGTSFTATPSGTTTRYNEADTGAGFCQALTDKTVAAGAVAASSFTCSSGQKAVAHTLVIAPPAPPPVLTRPATNYIAGTGITVAAADNPTLDAVDVTIASTVTGLPADTVVAAATRIIANLLAAGDTQPAWRVLGSGRQEWGPGGTTATDTVLERLSAGVLRATGGAVATGTATTSGGASTGPGIWMSVGGLIASIRTAAGPAVATSLVGDTGTSRLLIDSNGKLNWADGTLAAADTNLYRFDVGVVATDSSFQPRGAGTTAAAVNILNLGGAGQAVAVRVAGDTQNRLTIQATGQHDFGPGNAAADISLSRIGGGVLRLTSAGGFRVDGLTAATSAAFQAFVGADAQASFAVLADGRQRFGPGGSTSYDAEFRRLGPAFLAARDNAAGPCVLQADHRMGVASVTTARTGGAAAVLPSAPVKYLAMLDENGVRVYVPAYS